MTKLLSPSFSVTTNSTPNAHSLFFIFYTVALKWLCHNQVEKKREIIKDCVKKDLNAHHIIVMISKHLNSFFKRSSYGQLACSSYPLMVNGVTTSCGHHFINIHSEISAKLSLHKLFLQGTYIVYCCYSFCLFVLEGMINTALCSLLPPSLLPGISLCLSHLFCS